MSVVSIPRSEPRPSARMYDTRMVMSLSQDEELQERGVPVNDSRDWIVVQFQQ